MTMKIENKNIKVVGVSLPANLLKKADEKAAELYQTRSEYIKNLILFDLGLATVISYANTKKGQVK